MKNKAQLIQTIIAAAIAVILIILIVKPSGGASFNTDASTYFDLEPDEVQELIKEAGFEHDDFLSGDYDGTYTDAYRKTGVALIVNTEGYISGVKLTEENEFNFNGLKIGDTYSGFGTSEELIDSGWIYDNIDIEGRDTWSKGNRYLDVTYENGAITDINCMDISDYVTDGQISETEEIILEEGVQEESINESTSENETEGSSNIQDFIFPDSDSRYLTESDVSGMDAATIRLGINEIYARHGRAFETEDLNAYFSSKSWYTPIYSADEFASMENSVFNEYEKANITFLGGVRDRLNGNSTQSSAFTPNYIYGVYEIHDGNIDATAEIGFYSDSGEDYIHLSGATSDGSGFGEFEGTIRSSNGNSYTAVDESGIDVIDFIYNGTDAIEITNGYISTSGATFPGFGGVYNKMSEF